MGRSAFLAVAMILATAAAAVMAYGTDPFWGRFHNGVVMIVLAHRLQWLLATIALLGCIGLIVSVIAGYTRVRWLAALAPMLGLFAQRYLASPMRDFAIATDPRIVPITDSLTLGDDWVVGLTFNRQAYAFPFEALYHTPVLLVERHEQRFILMWSVFANRAVASTVDNPFKLRDLELVSMPANALLLFNRKIGQPINGLRGLTLSGEKPSGFLQPLETQKMPWKQWRELHPATLVMVPARADGPTKALAPRFEMPPDSVVGTDVTRPVIVVASTQPVAMAAESVASEAVSVAAGPTQLLLFRDSSGRVRAFDRQVNGDLFPILQRRSDPKHGDVVFVDRDSGSGWTTDCKATQGLLKGSQLRRILVDDGLYWGVMHYWMPELTLAEPKLPPPGVPEFTPAMESEPPKVPAKVKKRAAKGE